MAASPTPAASPGTLWQHCRSWLRSHPDTTSVTVIATVAALVRLFVLYRAPVFIMKDSESYFLPGWDMAHGLPFDLELRRTPVYSWFISQVLQGLGDDLFPIALVQHALGILTALVVYGIGRTLFGRPIGLVAGLLTALSGPLLIFEHYVMPEALFTFLLVSGVLLLLHGVRSGRLPWYAASGLILGVATLTRPAAQLVMLGLPLILLLHGRSLRAILAPCLATGAGAVVVLVPWMFSVYQEYGVVSTGATLGEPLIFRTVHQDRNFALPDPQATPYADPIRNEARRRVIELSARRVTPSAIVHQLRRDFKLSRPEADAALRDVAFEIIGNQPAYYLYSTLRLTASVFIGRHEALNLSWTNRRDRAGDDTLENWQSVPRIRHLVQPATEAQRSAYDSVNRLVNLFQPSLLSPLIGLFFAIGTIGCLLRPEWRPGFLLSLSAAALILTTTLVSGAVPRFRYPADPFIHLVAIAGIAYAFAVSRQVLAGLERRASRSEAESRQTPPAAAQTPATSAD